jgi:dihydroflavonol-4-reductase
MNIFLTGATGLIGSHILQQGLEKGYNFSCPVRKIKKRSFLSTCKDQVTLIEGDLLEDDFSLEGIDVVINCAALASPFPKDHEDMDKINVDFVKKLYQKTKEKSIRLVHISSIATLTDGTENFEVSENKRGNIRPTYYAQTKATIDEWLDQQDISPLTIHPCYVLGEFDSRPSSGAVFFALKTKKITKILERKKNFVAASDVAKGIFQAIDANCKGHYILGGENLNISEFIEYACMKLNILNEVQISNIDDLSVIEKEFSTSTSVTWKKAKEEFDYKPSISCEVFIDQAINYFVENKMLRISN